MKNLLRTLIYDSQVSLTISDTTELVKEGIKRHRLSQESARVFGEAISAMTFMSACLKNAVGEISLSLKSDGACDEIAISGNQNLFMRGYIGNTQMEGGMSALNMFGTGGSLTIIRDDGYSRPFVGSCALPQNGGVDEAFEEYFRISEQLPTRIKTSVEFDEKGECVFAGVIAVQPLPFAPLATQEKVQALDLASLLEKVKAQGTAAVAEETFDSDKRVWEERTAKYKCNCSRRYLLRVLVSLGEPQLRQIIQEDGAARIHCHYCNTDYEFTEEDADHLFPKTDK